jgi:biotin synthase
MGKALKTELVCLSRFTLNPQPESVPINALVAVEGTPDGGRKPVEIWEMIRMVATTRIIMPETQVSTTISR